jgi:hypothetical protein
MNIANTALIQEIYAAFARGDAPFIAANVGPEAVWDFNVGDSAVPWHAPVTGPTGVPKFLAAFVEHVQLEAFDPKRFIAIDEDVIAHIRIAYVVKRTGRRVEQEQLHWWTVRDGKIARLRHFEDTAQVVAAWNT